MKKESPSMDAWLREAKASPEAARCGMFLAHNGVVRRTAKAQVRYGAEGAAPVCGMRFGYDAAKAAAAVEETKALAGIHYVRVWLNEGELEVGESLMYVLIGGDIRPNCIDALQKLVGKIKNELVVEEEVYA